MSSNAQRRIDLILNGVDNASTVFQRATRNAKQSAKDLADTNRAIYGPQVRPRFDGAESQVRQMVAGRLRAIHDGHLREQREAIVHNEVLKRTATEGAGSAGDAIYGPSVRPRFSQALTEQRNYRAQRLRDQREANKRERFEAAAHNDELRRTAVEGAGSVDPNSPIYGPAARPRFTGATAAERAERARALLDTRREASRQIAESARRRALLGNSDLEQNGFAGREFMEGASKGGPRGPARLGEAEAGLYKRMKENTEGLERMLKVVRGVGAAGALAEGARIVGEGLQRLPEVTHEYAEAMKVGTTGTEFWSKKLADTIPGIGDLAKGFRAVYDAGQYLAQKAKDEYRQRQAERDETLKHGRERFEQAQAVTEPVVNASRNATTDAANSLRLGMTRGVERARIQAQIDYENEVRKIGHDTLTGPDLTEGEKAAQRKLTEEQRQQLNRDRATRLAAAEQRRAEAHFNIDRDASQTNTQHEHESQDRLFQIKSQATQRDLQLAGYGVSARIAMIHDETEQSIRELGRRNTEEERDLKDGSMEKIAAERRYREELAAIRQKGANDEIAERERARREDAASDRAFARNIQGTQAATIANRLRAAGASNDAEKVERAQAHRDRLKEIDEQEQEAKEKRGEWYARQGKAQFDAQRAAENDSYLASEAAAARERAQQFLPALFGNATGGAGLTGSLDAAAIDARLNQRDKEDKAAAEIAKMKQEHGRILTDILTTLKQGGVTLAVIKSS